MEKELVTAAKTTVTEEVSIRKETKPMPVAKAPAVQLEDTTPCNWVITPEGDGILAVNNVTGEQFEGTIEAFNAALKG